MRPWRAAALTALAVGMAAALAAPAASGDRWGPPGTAEIPKTRLFDIGVTDYDGDGHLDIFTTAHKARSVLLRNGGPNGFYDVLAPAGLSPTPAFPGLEYLRRPVMKDRAIYLYATDSRKEQLPGVIHLRSIGKQTAGNLAFGASKVGVLRAERATARVSTTPAGSASVDFRLQPGAKLDIRANHIDLPISASFPAPFLPPLPPGSAVQPRDIRVRTRAQPATSRRFVLNLRDRHGFVFADLIRDGATDLFAATGGLGGVIKLPGYRDRVQDEFFVGGFGGGARFAERSAGSGLRKNGCRGRQAAAIDIDANGLLDLFESCEDEPPQIYLKRHPGPFSSARSPRLVGATYRWANLGGRKPELLAAARRGITVLRREHRRWRVVQRIRGEARNGQVAHFALGNLDEDADLDVLAVAPSGNTLLRNVGGRLHEVSMSRLRLPAKSLAASFVDYDNDGRQDLHFVPQGLYRGTKNEHFARTGDVQVGKRAKTATTTWFDAENDGLRDPIFAWAEREFAPQKAVLRLRNRGPGGHWLEVDVTGPAGNRQAVGARVGVRAGGRWQYGWVGQNEGSGHSQGHYRVYFGLGRAARVSTVAVKWPNGGMTQLHDVVADRVVRIAWP